MTTTHAPLSWFAGDDWEIVATLLDENGEPYDLATAPEILWALMQGDTQIVSADDVVISILDATAGQCAIAVPAAITSALAAGQYTDALRIVDDGVTSTLSTGVIYVAADPWTP